MAIITGTPGDDNSLLGGNDLIGTGEADQISGLAGRDVLDGLEGNDTLLGRVAQNPLHSVVLGAGYILRGSYQPQVA